MVKLHYPKGEPTIRITNMVKLHYPKGEPTIRHRASIATWELTVSFYSKEQCKLFIDDLLDLELNFDIQYDYEAGDSLTLDVHSVTLGLSWANNLTTVAQILEKYDYNGGQEDVYNDSTGEGSEENTHG